MYNVVHYISYEMLNFAQQKNSTKIYDNLHIGMHGIRTLDI